MGCHPRHQVGPTRALGGKRQRRPPGERLRSRHIVLRLTRFPDINGGYAKAVVLIGYPEAAALIGSAKAAALIGSAEVLSKMR